MYMLVVYGNVYGEALSAFVSYELPAVVYVCIFSRHSSA